MKEIAIKKEKSGCNKKKY